MCQRPHPPDEGWATPLRLSQPRPAISLGLGADPLCDPTQLGLTWLNSFYAKYLFNLDEAATLRIPGSLHACLLSSLLHPALSLLAKLSSPPTQNRKTLERQVRPGALSPSLTADR